MKKPMILGAAALTLTTLLTAPLSVHASAWDAAGASQAFGRIRTVVTEAGSGSTSNLREKLDCDLFSRLTDTLENCDIRYGAVIINGNRIEFPSGGINKPENTPGGDDCENNGNTESKPEDNNSGNNNSGNTENKPEDNNSGSNGGNTPDDNNSGDTENKPEDNNPGSPEETPELSFARQVVELVNKERAKAGVSPLAIDAGLERAALVRSREIQTSFSHTRPNGSSFSSAIKEAGVTYRRSGENIAWGQRTPEAVVTAWMNSDGHRANILNPNFGRIGVGYLTNTSGTPYWTQLFAD